MTEQSSSSSVPEKDDEWGYDPNDDPEYADLQHADGDLKALLDQVDLDVKGWLPKPGSKLFGTVTDISTGTSEYGEYPLLTIQTPTSRLVGLHCFHQVLRNEIERKIKSGRLDVGDMIAVAYKGEGEAKGGNNAPHVYRVAIKRPAAPAPVA